MSERDPIYTEGKVLAEITDLSLLNSRERDLLLQFQRLYARYMTNEDICCKYSRSDDESKRRMFRKALDENTKLELESYDLLATDEIKRVLELCYSGQLTVGRQSSKTYCRQCGAELYLDSKYCSKCGTKVITTNNTQITDNKAKESESNSLKKDFSDALKKIFGQIIRFFENIFDTLSDIPVVGPIFIALISIVCVLLVIGGAVAILIGVWSINFKLGATVFILGMNVIAYLSAYKWKNRNPRLFWALLIVSIPALIGILIVA